jgi:predicted RNA-binding Zn-ribbon protein involved in translation (DUF1610 family)
MAGEEPDVNEIAFRVVEEATFGSPKCPACGGLLERRERDGSVYFGCPKCGEEVYLES